MSDVQSVTVQLRGPSANSPGQITEGYFIVEGDTLIMTYGDGSPVDRDRFCATLKPGDNATAIAGVLTPKVRLAAMGLTEEEDAFFNRSLHYGGSVA